MKHRAHLVDNSALLDRLWERGDSGGGGVGGGVGGGGGGSVAWAFRLLPLEGALRRTEYGDEDPGNLRVKHVHAVGGNLGGG